MTKILAMSRACQILQLSFLIFINREKGYKETKPMSMVSITKYTLIFLISRTNFENNLKNRITSLFGYLPSLCSAFVEISSGVRKQWNFNSKRCAFYWRLQIVKCYSFLTIETRDTCSSPFHGYWLSSDDCVHGSSYLSCGIVSLLLLESSYCLLK